MSRRYVYFVGAGRPRKQDRVHSFTRTQRKTKADAVYNHRNDYEFRVRIDYTLYKMFFAYDRGAEQYFAQDNITWDFLSRIAEVRVYLCDTPKKELVGLWSD